MPFERKTTEPPPTAASTSVPKPATKSTPKSASITAADIGWGALIAAAFGGAMVTDDRKWKGRLLALSVGMGVNLALEHALRKK